MTTQTALARLRKAGFTIRDFADHDGNGVRWSVYRGEEEVGHAEWDVDGGYMGAGRGNRWTGHHFYARAVWGAERFSKRNVGWAVPRQEAIASARAQLRDAWDWLVARATAVQP